MIEISLWLNRNFVNGKEHWALNCEKLNIFVIENTPRQALVRFANKVKMLKNSDLKKVVE